VLALALVVLLLIHKSKYTMEASPEQITEYEAQLADVQELLKASPDDAALLSLKKGLGRTLGPDKGILT